MWVCQMAGTHCRVTAGGSVHLSRACQLHASGLLMDRNFNGLPQCSQDEAIKKGSSGLWSATRQLESLSSSALCAQTGELAPPWPPKPPTVRSHGRTVWGIEGMGVGEAGERGGVGTGKWDGGRGSRIGEESCVYDVLGHWGIILQPDVAKEGTRAHPVSCSQMINVIRMPLVFIVTTIWRYLTSSFISNKFS